MLFESNLTRPYYLSHGMNYTILALRAESLWGEKSYFDITLDEA